MGLCFKCDEKFTPCHKCKKFFRIESTLEEETSEGSEEDLENDEIENDENSRVPAISLNDITGTSTLNTMKVMGSNTWSTCNGIN